MNAAAATERIRVLVLGEGHGVKSFEFLAHCIEGMRAHGIRSSEVYDVIATSTAREQEDGRWSFDGIDSQDRDIRIVIEVDLSVQATFVTVHLVTEKGI